MKSRVSIRRLALVCTVVLIGGFAIGYLAAYDRNPDNPEKSDVAEMVEEGNGQPSDNTIMDYVPEPRTTSDTRLIFKSSYSGCGHTVAEQQKLREELVGLDENEIHKHYPDWEVEKFHSEEVVLHRQIEGVCPGHYILGIENGYVAVYQTIDGGKRELIRVTDIPASILRLRDQERLREGMLLDSMEEVNQYLEDLGS